MHPAFPLSDLWCSGIDAFRANNPGSATPLQVPLPFPDSLPAPVTPQDLAKQAQAVKRPLGHLPADDHDVYETLQKYLVEPQLRTVPRVDFAMPLVSPGNASDKIPKLLLAYLAVGAKICGPPAIDRDFKTIDFLTLMDLKNLPARVRTRFLRG